MSKNQNLIYSTQFTIDSNQILSKKVSRTKFKYLKTEYLGLIYPEMKESEPFFLCIPLKEKRINNITFFVYLLWNQFSGVRSEIKPSSAQKHYGGY